MDYAVSERCRHVVLRIDSPDITVRYNYHRKLVRISYLLLWLLCKRRRVHERIEQKQTKCIPGMVMTGNVLRSISKLPYPFENDDVEKSGASTSTMA